MIATTLTSKVTSPAGMEYYEPMFSFLSGVLCHHIIWIRGEWDEVFWKILSILILTHHIVTCAWAHLANIGFRYTYLLFLRLELCHALSTFLSIFIYRAYFHPLCRFPGPFGLRVSMWWRMKTIWITGHRHAIWVDQLHESTESTLGKLCIVLLRDHTNAHRAIPLIHGSGSYTALTKGPSYLNPVNSGFVNADCDPEHHLLRRIKWDRALSSKSLPNYTPQIRAQVSKLIKRIESHPHGPVQVNNEIKLFTLDLIGSIGFGLPNGFGALDSGLLYPVFIHLREMMRVGVCMMALPWLHCLLSAIPNVGIYRADVEFRDFVKWTLNLRSQSRGLELDEERLGQNIMTEKKQPSDIMSNLLSPLPESRSSEDVKLTHTQIVSDAVILLLAGTDTTTSALINALYRLARHPGIQSTLYSCIASLGPEVLEQGDLLTADQVAKLAYLEAFITETLRLHTPAATGLPRVVPSTGLTLDDGTYIPPKTGVSSPPYSLHHDHRSFRSPFLFLPERWLSEGAIVPEGIVPHPDMIVDKRAFMAFGVGPYGCPGKKLAYVEMKMLLANLILKFEILFPEGMTVEEMDRKVETGWKDYTSLQPGKIELRFVARTRGVS